MSKFQVLRSSPLQRAARMVPMLVPVQAPCAWPGVEHERSKQYNIGECLHLRTNTSLISRANHASDSIKWPRMPNPASKRCNAGCAEFRAPHATGSPSTKGNRRHSNLVCVKGVFEPSSYTNAGRTRHDSCQSGIDHFPGEASGEEEEEDWQLA